jgi:hypothetical protein
MIALQNIRPAHDHSTVTHQELIADLFGKRRWGFASVDRVIAQTEKAIKVYDVNESGWNYHYWIPKSVCEAINYMTPSGNIIGAIRFPFKFVK